MRAARFFSTSFDSYLIFKSLNYFGLRDVLISQRIFSHMFVLMFISIRCSFTSESLPLKFGKLRRIIHFLFFIIAM